MLFNLQYYLVQYHIDDYEYEHPEDAALDPVEEALAAKSITLQFVLHTLGFTSSA